MATKMATLQAWTTVERRSSIRFATTDASLESVLFYEVKKIGPQSLALPNEAPVMVLPNALLLPNAPLPLYIFERRYREMLDYSLHHERMFCIALMKPGHAEPASAEDFFHVAGLGLIRACVENPDGTSYLILQGLARVQLTGFVQEKPFRIARIRELRSKVPNPIEAEALSVKVLEICSQLKAQGREVPAALAQYPPHLSNPEVLSDIVTHAFVQDPLQRQHILEQLVVSERLRLLIRFLQNEAN